MGRAYQIFLESKIMPDILLIATLNSFETTGDTAWNVDRLKARAQGFSEELFRERMETYLQKVVVESYS